MNATANFLAAGFVGLASALTLGCADSTGPTIGTIEISVRTASASTDIDPDGYSLSIDDGPTQAVAVDATVTIAALPIGRHFVRLGGLASNCVVNGANPLAVDVTTDKPASAASFSVACLGSPSPWDY